jgi:hypothetical protein
MRTIAEHQQPPRMLHDLALVERARHVKAIITVDHDLDAAAFAAIAEQHDRVATSRSHAAIVPISRGQRNFSPRTLRDIFFRPLALARSVARTRSGPDD